MVAKQALDTKESLQEHKVIKYRCWQSGLWAPKHSGQGHVSGARRHRANAEKWGGHSHTVWAPVPDSLLHPRARPSTAVAFLLAPALPPSPPWFFAFAPFIVFRSRVPDILSLNSPEEFSSLSIYVGRGLGSLTGGSLFYSCWSPPSKAPAAGCFSRPRL